jgi:Transglutaminase-like superfamily
VHDRATNGFSVSASEVKLYLSDQVHCCEFEDGAVILDMRAVTYLGIDAEHLPDLSARIENWPNSKACDLDTKCTDSPSFQELVANLLARGIVTTVPAKARLSDLPRPATVLTNADWGPARHRIPITHLLHFCTSLLWVLLRRRPRSLASLLSWIGRQQAAIRRNEAFPNRQIAGGLLTSFFRLRIWFYTAYRYCLFDSLVLSVFLTLRRVPCTLVIGVSTKPFAAHAWVQIGDCVLNDTVEHVQTFAPILAIGNCS